MRLDYSSPLIDSADFSLLEYNLGRDLESSIRMALAENVAFPYGGEPLEIFRKALSTSIRDIESHPKGILFQEFLRKGPYEDQGAIPKEIMRERLTDDETASAITFIYSHMVNCFKGDLAELLALEACISLVKSLKHDGKLPSDARVYYGDTVLTPRKNTKGLLKCADQHLLSKEVSEDGSNKISILAITEVKSYKQSKRRFEQQLNNHICRALNGLVVCNKKYGPNDIYLGERDTRNVIRIAVVPSSWKLPRKFQYVQNQEKLVLRMKAPRPPRAEDVITRTGKYSWKIELKWSVEALAQAAFEMTFWYMGKVGEVIYSQDMPKKCIGMTPAQAGKNAVKMMLYYAILRCSSIRQQQRAIALYNSYCFGYSLGMNFKNKQGKREMLWPEDLNEIASFGETKSGCVIK